MEKKYYTKEVEYAIRKLQEIDSNVFYTALAIYEWSYIDTEITDELCEKVRDYLSDVETIYDRFVREDVREIFDEQNKE